MTTTITHGNISDYQATIEKNPAENSDYKLCPLSNEGAVCGSSCAWWDSKQNRCAIISIARRK